MRISLINLFSDVMKTEVCFLRRPSDCGFNLPTAVNVDSCDAFEERGRALGRVQDKDWDA